MSSYQQPVAIQNMKINYNQIQIEYPQLIQMNNTSVQHHINQIIYNNVLLLMEEQQKYQSGSHPQVIGHFEIKTNERGILSLTLSNYTYTQPMAHGFTILKSLTFSVNTGQLYSLADLFKAGANYVEIISKEITKQIKERDIPVIEPFQKIRPDQDFYLADKSIVVYFQLYELSPYYVGFPMFPISVYSLLDMSKEEAPLSILAIAAV